MEIGVRMSARNFIAHKASAKPELGQTNKTVHGEAGRILITPGTNGILIEGKRHTHLLKSIADKAKTVVDAGVSNEKP